MSQQPLLVTTTERPAGYEVKQALGQVFGVVVRSRGLGGNVMAGLRSLAGGEIIEYTRLVEDTRRHAIDRMVENARAMGANAVVMMRFDSSEMGQTMVTTQLVILVIVIVFAIVGYFVWDRRYRGQSQGSFKPTGEVFKDPTSGKLTRVYEDPATGRRQYREEP